MEGFGRLEQEKCLRGGDGFRLGVNDGWMDDWKALVMNKVIRLMLEIGRAHV